MSGDAAVPERTGGSPWWWEDLDGASRAERWDRFEPWVEWLVEAYAPWVALPPCWALHEGMCTELKVFWTWHEWAIKQRSNPVDAVRWHQDLRSSAKSWRELATCKHEPESVHLSSMSQRRNQRTADFVRQARRLEQGN